MTGNESPATMYRKGRRESTKPRQCDGWECACTLTYWDRRLGAHPHYNAFLDGWSDATNGSWEYAKQYGVTP